MKANERLILGVGGENPYHMVSITILENLRYEEVRLEDKEYFSESLIETKKTNFLFHIHYKICNDSIKYAFTLKNLSQNLLFLKLY